jgi:hypothetical protein
MGGRPGFEFRAIVVEVGVARIYNEAAWQDALVVVAAARTESAVLVAVSRR